MKTPAYRNPMVWFAISFIIGIAWSGSHPAAQQIDKDDMLWIKGSTPKQSFNAIFVPSCLSCNDFTTPERLRRESFKAGVPVVLVIRGFNQTIDASAFGDKWPNVVCIPVKVWNVIAGDAKSAITFESSWKQVR